MDQSAPHSAPVQAPAAGAALRLLVAADAALVDADVLDGLGRGGFAASERVADAAAAAAAIAERRHDVALVDVRIAAAPAAGETVAALCRSHGLPVVWLGAAADRPLLDEAAVGDPLGAVAAPADARLLGAMLQAAFHRHAAAAARADLARLQRRAEVFDAMLKALPDGVMVIDADDRLLADNDQFYDVLRIDQAAARASGDPVRYARTDFARRGEYGPGDPEVLQSARVAQTLQSIAAGQTVASERTLTDGRVIETRVRMLTGGGRLAIYRDITAAKRREAELARQSGLLETILSAMGEGITVFDRDQRLVALNRRCCELTGLPPDSIGATARELILHQARAGEYGPCDPEAEADRRLRAFWVDRPVVARRVRPGDGRIIEVRRYPAAGGGSIALYADVTAREAAASALAEKTRILEAMLDAMPDGVQVVDANRRGFVANDQLFRLLAIDKAAALAAPDALHYMLRTLAARGEYGPGDPDALAQARIATLFPRVAAERLVRYERLFRHGRWIEVRLIAIDGGGQLAIYRDTTESKQREAELARQSALLQTIFSTIGEGIAVVDEDLRLVAANARSWELTGVNPALVQRGTPLRDILVSQARAGEFGPCDPEAEADRRIAAIRANPAAVGERTRPDGRSVELRRSPIAGGGYVTVYVDTTARREIERRLAESNRLLDSMFEHIPAMVFMKRAADLRFERFNRAGAELLGVPAEAFVGRTDHDIFPAEQADAFVAADRAVLSDAGGGRHEQEEPIRTAGGETRWLRTAKIALRDAAGCATHLLGVSIDITERRRAEDEVRAINATLAERVAQRTAALAESEERTRRIVETALDAVVTIDGAGRITGWNPQAEAIFGWRALDVVGQAFEDTIIPPAQRTAADGRRLRLIETGDPGFLNRRLEIAALRRDGAEIAVELSITALGLAGTAQYSAFIRDITERKAAEAALAAARANLQDAIESMREGLVLYDRDDRVVVFNDAFVDHYSEIAGAIRVGVRFEDMFRAAIVAGSIPLPAERALDEFVAERVAIHQRADRGPIRRFLKGGRVLEVRERRARNGGVIATGTDITDLLRVEQQLREAQKMEALGKLTGGMAHDFNNYLAAIIGNLDLVREGLPAGRVDPGMVDAAIQAALRAADLTRSLLAFARRQPLDPRRIDLNQRIGTVVGILRRTLGPDIAIATALDDAPWPVRVDGAQLDSCLVNLANNARDAMPRGGTLSIATRNMRLDDAYVREHPEAAPGDYVEIAVGDSGAGMAAETLARAFEPFFTTKGAGHGTGLGLSMVHGFVKQSGGHVAIYSEPGRGTVVRLYLPRDRGPGPAAPDEADAAERVVPAGGGETVLVVEDNGPTRAAAVAQLAALGYRVLEAADGDAALALLDAATEAVDVLFTDIVMPGTLDGVELAERARARRPALKVLLTSGFPGDVLRRSGQARADLPLLGKPYRKLDLARALRRVIDGGPDRSSSA